MKTSARKKAVPKRSRRKKGTPSAQVSWLVHPSIKEHVKRLSEASGLSEGFHAEQLIRIAMKQEVPAATVMPQS